MARETRKWLPPGGQRNVEFIDPKEQRKAEFARRLGARLLEKGWKQSDLARAAFGTTHDSEGRVVPRGRDSISTYMRRRTLPDPTSLKKLADALGCEMADLDPMIEADAIEYEAPALEMRSAAQRPDRAWLRVNKVVSFETAAKVVTLIQEDEKKKD